MARAGASKSLDKPAPKARGASKAATPAPVKAASKAVRKKTDPVAVAPKPAAKAAKPAAKSAKAAQPAKQVKAVKAAKPTATTGKVVKTAPAKAVKATKAKAPQPVAKTPVAKPPVAKPPVAKTASTRKTTGGTPPNSRATEVAQVAEPKGKRAATATKAPAKAAPVAAVKPDSAATFPAKTLEKLRRLLEEERETYVRQAHDLAAEAEALAAEREPGDTQFDEESGEGDTLNVERERDLALSASATQAVEEIDRALGRMDKGTFGICERCGKKIAVARLEALPFAALCIECKSREERRR
jgi:RNA polymerase-binding transcription factor DksA